jgi:peptidoglycan/LPS O-acetylase OafA/YrhL
MVGEHPKIDRFYRPELDVVRFLAFLFIFLAHNLPRSSTPRVDSLLGAFSRVFCAAANACVFGVSLFFSLSAFLICELLLRERSTIGTVSVKRFYIRRILRIWPLYYVGLALGVLFAFTPFGNRSELASMGWYALFMGAWQAAMHGLLSNPMFVLWSVSVEEQFYLFVPWLVRCFSRKALLGFCIAIVFASNLWIYRLSTRGADGDRIWVDSIAQFQCFATGILVCLVLNGRIPRIATWLRLFLMASSAACWIFAKYGPMQGDFHSQPLSWPYFSGYLLASFGSAMILVAFLGIDPKLLPRWAVSLGRISFGLYVFHVLAQVLVLSALQSAAFPWFPMSVFRICAIFGLSVLMANLSYRYFETPFLRLKTRLAVIESRPI